MTEAKRTRKRIGTTHADHLVGDLTPSQRNSLILIMGRELGVTELREALGISHVHITPGHAELTGLAMTGQTAKLFQSRSETTNLKAGSRSVETGGRS